MSKNSNGGSKLQLNKWSFWLTLIVAILHLVAMILGLMDFNSKLVSALQGVATALIICIVAVLGWRYVKGRALVWKILYTLALLVVLVCIVAPLIF